VSRDEGTRPRVAMLAYACDPDGGGEHWLGWGWAEQASQFCDVHLFTPPKSRAAIERHAARVGITPHFVELPAWKRRSSRSLGRAGKWWRKIAWAKLAARLVARLHRDCPIHLVHQTTFHTFRVPFYAASLGIPSVWGPIAGGEHTPSHFDALLGESASAERSRALTNLLWLASPPVQRALRESHAIFVSNRTTLAFLPDWCHKKCTVVPPNTFRAGDEPVQRSRSVQAAVGGLSLLYVGNCVATRSLPIVLQALTIAGLDNCRLVVAGLGSALESWKSDAERLGLSPRVQFTGLVDRRRLAELYGAADVFVFPALRDAGGSGLLEAMSLGLPVVCLEWGGPAEMIDDTSGIRIEVSSPADTIRNFAAALARLQANPVERMALGRRGAERAKSLFTWQAKQRLLERTYWELIDRS
jgi:glycosyltransferase involved in cell wall biosynthesis